ncbi:MAG: proline racemase [Anaerolineae bacterium]|nr:proline racemase family protein [Anaerolineales bacterium]MCQ3978978.1 proline racemase [Anaerolineae bacterium]
MDALRLISTVDTHTAGEPTRIVTAGLPPLPGATMAAKRDYFAAHLDGVRRFLTQEPRGHSAMHVAVLTPPTRPEADAAGLIMNSFGFLNMCGHGTLGVITALVELGLVPAPEPVTQLTFETLGGLIPLEVEVTGRTVKNITFRNLPAFSYHHNIALDLPALGQVIVDVVYGGLWYGVVEAAQVGLPLDSAHIDELLRLGVVIRRALNEQIQVRHPATGQPERIELTLFIGPPDHPDAHGKGLVTMGQHIFDRSPGGTGTSARMVHLWAKGQLPLGQEFIHESIIGTLFRGRLIEETAIGSQPAVIPEISGRAFITGMHQFVLTADDPLAEGFLVGGP